VPPQSSQNIPNKEQKVCCHDFFKFIFILIVFSFRSLVL
jgi:hypothetical protein